MTKRGGLVTRKGVDARIGVVVAVVILMEVDYSKRGGEIVYSGSVGYSAYIIVEITTGLRLDTNVTGARVSYSLTE